MDGDVLVDSYPPAAPRIFWGLPWDAALFNGLWPGEPLPPILMRCAIGDNNKGLRDENALIATGGGLAACAPADGPCKP